MFFDVNLFERGGRGCVVRLFVRGRCVEGGFLLWLI